MTGFIFSKELSSKSILRLLKAEHYALLAIILISHLSYLPSKSIALITIVQLSMLFKALFLYCKPEKRVMYIVASLFLGAEIGMFLFTLLFFISSVFRKSNIILHRQGKYVLILAMYSFCIFIISSISEFLPLNYILWFMIFFGPYALYYAGLEINLNALEGSQVKAFLLSLLLLQILLVTLQGVFNGGFSPGDWAIGTFLDAHKLGFVFLFAIVYVVYEILIEKRVIGIVLFSMASLGLILCDAKAVLLSSFIACLLISVLSVINIKSFQLIIYRGLAVYLLIVTAVLLFIALIFTDLFDSWDEFLDLYVWGDLTSSKYKIYIKVWGDMFTESPFYWFVGVGPGELASKASNMLSADVLWKSEGGMASLLPVSSSGWTREYMNGLFSHDIVKNIPNVSAVLVYPFAGFISIKAELGFFGLLLYLITNFSIVIKGTSGPDPFLNRALLFFGVTFFVALLFDNFHEQIPLAGLFFLLLGLNTKSIFRS